ncbi:MAG: hypothetical protein ABIO36_07585 [Pyrinomonadaceae bacterium]
MNKKIILKKQCIFGIAMLMIAIGLSACSPAATNNSSAIGNSNMVTNGANGNKSLLAASCDASQVWKDILTDINRNYPYLESRKNHLWAVVSEKCEVTLLGYTDTLQNFKDFIKVASSPYNVTKVKVDGLYIDKDDFHPPTRPSECPDGGLPCGDFCVPRGQCWYIEIKKEKEEDSNKNSNTNSNSISRP